MKLLFIIRSRILSRKKYFILVMITLVLSSVMFNFVFNAVEQYVKDIIYIEKNDYENSIVIIRFSAYVPITNDTVDDMLKEHKISREWHYHTSNTLTLYSPEISFDGFEDYMKKTVGDGIFQTNHEKDMCGTLSCYDKEYSEFVDTALIGEKPDINKDYGGKMPVIAGCESALGIGDSAEYSCGGVIVPVTVTAKYADNSLDRYLAGRVVPENYYYTDIEIMRKYKVLPSEDELPSFVESNKEVEWSDRTLYNVTVMLKNDKDAPFPETLARAEKLEEDSYADANKNDMSDHGDLFRGNIRAGVMNTHFIMPRWAVDYDNRDLIKLLPLFIMIFIIGTVGITASVILSADSSIKSTAVFKLCGCRERTVIASAVLSELFAVVPSLIAAILVCRIAEFFAAAKFITPISFLLTSAYMLLLFAIMTVTEIITLTRSKMLDTVRRFETLS